MMAMADWQYYSFGDLLSYEQPGPYIVESTDYDDSYATPVLTAGKSFIIGYTNEKHGIYSSLPVIIFDDFTTSSQYVNFEFKVKSSAMKILTPNQNLILPKFAYYLMQITHVEHSTHKRYWIQHYAKVKVKIPPLPEQQRIVTRIEALFSDLDNGVATLRTTKRLLELYRQSVLKEAFEGKYINSPPQGYSLLGKFIEKPKYGTSKKCRYERNDCSWPVFRIPNVDHYNSVISHDDIKYANFSNEESLELQLKKDDILIIRSNGSVSLVGRAALIREEDSQALYAGYLMRLRIKRESHLLARYLLHYLNSYDARLYIERTAKSTSGVNNINASEVSKINIPVFSIDEQERIVEEIDARLSVCSQIKQTVDAALQKSDALRQSILKQAFEGKL